ncbi:MAG: D-alanyl-D-alanine carboxypeptidase [Pseudomonadales bacterium]|nr:D-alanyl-D-alanine carboxypeptidase [Pseudomonadales bacterium]MCP5330879.1 D-alanyl-D-alanine carboxypeptidase [Pseudomonadales bacterium]MCP5343259.1 D-alanyl-D-alanine carboxypeptidase [Pseudomonadales bacterium]
MTGSQTLMSRARQLASPVLAAVAFVSSLAFTAQAVAQNPGAMAIIPRPPQIAASSYILLDAVTGKVIVEENADVQLPPASLTKIMTAYIAEVEIDNGNMSLDDEVHISEKAWRTQGSKMFVDVNSNVRVEDLLRGIIIQSGNDASVAMAEHLAGSEDAFADMMNQHAQRLGMTNTFFMNASGLDTEERYNIMSARDLATLARATILEHPTHYALYSEKEFTYNGIRQPNRNTLLFRDRNIDGMKTGWTTAAGYCLVASGERDGMRLISVVMGTASEDARATESQKLMTYGFRYFETAKLYSAGDVLSTAKVWSGKENSVELGMTEDLVATIPRGQAGELQATLNIDETIRAPIEQGQVLGTVEVKLGEDTIYQGNVAAVQAVERAGLLKRLIDFLTMFFANLFS